MDSNKVYLESLNMYLHAVGLPTSTVLTPKHKKNELANRADDLPGMKVRVMHPPTEMCNLVRCQQRTDQSLHDMIMHMNDDHHWTREQIADWIETLDDVPTFIED